MTATLQGPAAYTERLTAPLLARLEAQAERIGRLEAEPEQARAQLAERPIPQPQHSAPPVRAGRLRWWQRLAWG